MLALSSCGLFPDKKGDPLPDKINVLKPAKNIEGRSEQQKDLAKQAKKKAPIVEPEMDKIAELAESNIEDAKAIQKEQPKIDKSREDFIKLKEQYDKAQEELKEAHKNILIRCLIGLAVFGLIACAGGIIYFFKTFQKDGLMVAGGGAVIAGLSIFTIFFLKQIVITIGIAVLIVVVILIIKFVSDSKKHKDHKRTKKVVEELIDTFEDPRDVAKEKHSPDTRVFVAEHKYNQK